VDGDRVALQRLNRPHDDRGCVQVGVGGGVHQPPGDLGRVAGLAGEVDPDRPAVLQQRALLVGHRVGHHVSCGRQDR
jgi:hypothetical protein